MKYSIPSIDDLNHDLLETIKSIEEIIDDLNVRRDRGLDSNLEKQLKDRIKINHIYHSNAIEGSQLTLRETEIIVKNLSSNNKDLTSSRGRIEASDLNLAYDYLLRLASGNDALSSLSLRQLHELILKNTNPSEAGKYRSVNVEIKNANHSPPDFLHVEENINEMFTWMNRNIHKYNPIIMGSILHHWITWIHPFSDGNGRVSRLFLNFFLLQKGYPEIIIKIDDRDNYYNALESADKGNFDSLFELIATKIDKSVTIIESFLNETDRRKEFTESYKHLGEMLLDKQKKKHSYQYEVWKSAINSFKNMFKEIVDDLSVTLPTIEMECHIYDDLTFDQYLGILEKRKVYKNWIMRLTFFDQNKNKRFSIPFFPMLFSKKKPLKLLGVNVQDRRNPNKMLTVPYNRRVLIVARIKEGGESPYEYLSKDVDFFNLQVRQGNLYFGLRDRNKQYAPEYKVIKSEYKPPQSVITKFLEDVIRVYLGYQPD